MWEVSDAFGQTLALGIYFLRIDAKSVVSERNLSSVKKMLLVR
jgi:hypothetical protein